MNPCIPHHYVIMVARTSIISESEVSITILCLLCSPCYTTVRIKNCSKGTSVIKVATMRNTVVPRTPVIVWNWSIHCPSLSAMFDLLHSSTNLKSISVLIVATMKNMDDFSLRKGNYHTQPPDEWNTKEDTSKSLKNALHVLQYAKRHFLGWSNDEQWKNQAHSLSRYRVTLVWRHQLVS